MSRVLLAVRALGLGDLLTAIPALRALRRGFPEHEIVLATPPALGPLALSSGAVDRISPTTAPLRTKPGRLTWTEPPPDVAVNLHGGGHRTLLALRPGRLLAFADPIAKFRDGPEAPSADLHEVDRWCALLGAYRLRADPNDLVIPAPEAPPEHSGALIVHPGAADPGRCWPPERFAELIRLLRQFSDHILLTGTPGERPAALAIAKAAGLPESAVLAGETTVVRLAELVGSARLLVCGDTGVAHLATALRTPSILLFGPRPPSIWGPRIDPHLHTVLAKGPAGLLQITPGEVHRVADYLLGQMAGRRI